ncbi:MAG: hypothetical protein JNK05_31550 [Myxococcales bacterium]|nr:hypothetical protein [Myxococcales bacterium]
MENNQKQGWTETKIVEGKIVETAYFGKILPSHLDEVRIALEAALRKSGGGDWLVDTTKASGFRPAASESSSAFFDAFRRLGGKRIAVAVSSAPLRMLGSALAFASGQDIKLFASRDEALQFLRSS